VRKTSTGRRSCTSAGQAVAGSAQDKEADLETLVGLGYGYYYLIFFIATSGGEDNNSSSTTPSSFTSTAQGETPAPAVVPMVITTDDLIDDLRENALKASNTYKEQYVELTGELSNIDSSGKYFSLSKLSDDFSLDSVLCRIDENHLDTVMNFSMGLKVTVTGTITDVGEVLGYTMKVETIK